MLWKAILVSCSVYFLCFHVVTVSHFLGISCWSVMSGCRQDWVSCCWCPGGVCANRTWDTNKTLYQTTVTVVKTPQGTLGVTDGGLKSEKAMCFKENKWIPGVLFIQKKKRSTSSSCVGWVIVGNLRAIHSPDLLSTRTCVFVRPDLCQVLIDDLTTSRTMTQHYGLSD